MLLCPSFCLIGISLLLLPPLCRPFLTDNLRHWSHDGVGTFLPICRICKCSRQNGVECVPRRDGEQFKLRRVHLPRWADSLSVSNFSFAAFPLFASAPHLRQLRLRYCAIATALPPLAFLPFHSLESVKLTDCRLRDDALPSALFQPLGQLREVSLSGNGLRDVRIELATDQILDRFDLSQNPLCPSRKNSDKTHGKEWPLTRQLRLENANVKAVNGTHWTFGEAENEQQQQQNNSSKSGECHWPISDGHWNALEQLRLGENLALQLHLSVLPRLATLRHLDLTDAASVPEELFLEWTRHPETQWHHIGMRRAKIKRTVADHPIVNTDAGNRNGKHNQWTLCSTNLEWLDISELKGIEDGTLRLDGCARLKWLYADANDLEAIRIGDSGPAALLSLSARDNRLRRWPAGLLRSAHSLSSVQLANNAIVRLPLGLLEQYPELNSLDLSQNAIRHFPVGDLSHPPQNSLMFLNLSQNQLRSVELPTLSSLTVLDLSDNLLAKFDSLGRLPALEHLHLSGNAGIRLTVTTEHPTLIRLHLGKCSLTKMPDLSRLVALRQLDLRGNQLESVPGFWLPSRGVNVLAIGSNALRELGWDWHTEQLDALRELRAEENPWKCACAFVPSLEQLLTPQTQQKKIQSGHFCPAGDSQRKMAKKCPREGEQKKKHNEEEEDALAAQFEDDSLPNALVFFLPPFALITAAFIGIILLLRDSLKRKWRHENSSASTPFAYQLIWPNGEAI